MPVGSKFAFLQMSNGAITTFDTAGTTITFSTTAQPNDSVRIQNLGTATVWIGLGSQSTSSAAVSTQGMMVPPATVVGSIQVIRSGGQTTLAAFTKGATQTAVILTVGGEGHL